MDELSILHSLCNLNYIKMQKKNLSRVLGRESKNHFLMMPSTAMCHSPSRCCSEMTILSLLCSKTLGPIDEFIYCLFPYSCKESNWRCRYHIDCLHCISSEFTNKRNTIRRTTRDIYYRIRDSIRVCMIDSSNG